MALGPSCQSQSGSMRRGEYRSFTFRFSNHLPRVAISITLTSPRCAHLLARTASNILARTLAACPLLLTCGSHASQRRALSLCQQHV